MKKWSVTAILTVILAFSACTHNVYLSPNPRLPEREKINVDVGLFVDRAQIAQRYTYGGSCFLGVANEWIVETGPAVRLTAERAFKAIFARVEVLENMSDFAARKDLALLIVPKIDAFTLASETKANITISCDIMNQAGATVYHGAIPAVGLADAGDSAAIYFLGALSGESALSNTADDAFAKAFVFLADDILKKVDFIPYLKK
jgi:hypothetical protein